MSDYLKVFKLLTREMNGAVSGAMSERGLDYSMNYGVSLVTIKSIAKQFFPNHDLAQDLFRQEVREMKLAAIYVEDPKCVTVESANKWSEKWENVEIAQLTAVELFAKSDVALEIAKQWFGGENQLKHLAACYIVGKIAQNLESRSIQEFVNPKNNAYALREIYKAHASLRQNILEFADQVPDLKWQLDYI